MLRLGLSASTKGEINRRYMGKKLIGDWQPSEKTLAWCHANGFDAGAHLEFFRDYCESTEAKYANFDAAFRNCCRSDWGGIRKAQKPKSAAWWTSDESILAHGRSLGIEPRPGESMANYKARLERA